MAEPIGNLVVRISGDATELLAAFKKSDAAMQTTAQQFAAVGRAAAAFAAASAATGLAIFAMVKGVANAQDELGKMSQKVGVSVESLSALKYAADLSDVSLESLGIGLKQLSKHMVEAQSGTGEAAEAFRALHLDVEASRGVLKPTEDMLLQLAEKFAIMEDGAGKTALAMRIFGKSGADLIPLLNQGRAGIEQLKEEARRLGIVISTEAAKAAEEFNDNLRRLEASSKGLTMQLAGPLIKALGDAAGEMTKAKLAGEGFFAVWTAGIRSLLTGDDVIKWSKDMAEATNRLLQAETAAARGPSNAFGENKRAMQKRLDDELAAARADVARLQAIKPIIAPDETPNAPAKRKPAPQLPDLAKEQREREFLAKQLEENAEEEIKTASEVAHWTAFYRDKILEHERQVIDDRAKAMMDAYDREQDAAITQGTIMQQLDSDSHSVKLDKLRGWFDENYAENESHRQALLDLDTTFSDAELEALGGRQAVIERMEQEHQDRLRQIRGRGNDDVLSMMKAFRDGDIKDATGYLASLTSGLASGSKRMFELNKIATEANVIMKGIDSVMASYNWASQWGGPPAGIAAAAVAGAFALAQLQAVRATTFGGGSAPSVAGTAAAPAVTAVPQSGGGGRGGPDTVIHLHGDTFSRKQLRDLFEQMNENQTDGGRIVFAQ